MSKKKLQVEGIMNELEGASLFFTRSVNPPLPPTPEPITESVPPPQVENKTPVETPKPDVAFESTPIEDAKTSEVYNEQKSNSASKLASKPIHKTNDLIKTIRKSVKQVGKEVLFIRLSPEEKRAVGSIVYSFN
jgi:hypothetical protein